MAIFTTWYNLKKKECTGELRNTKKSTINNYHRWQNFLPWFLPKRELCPGGSSISVKVKNEEKISLEVLAQEPYTGELNMKTKLEFC